MEFYSSGQISTRKSDKPSSLAEIDRGGEKLSKMAKNCLKCQNIYPMRSQGENEAGRPNFQGSRGENEPTSG